MKRNLKMGVSAPGGNASKGSLRYTISIPPVMAQELGITPEDRDIILTLEDHKITIEKGEVKELIKFTGVKAAVGQFNGWQGHAEIMLNRESGKVWCDVFANGQEWIEYSEEVSRLMSKSTVRMDERDDKTSMREINERAEVMMKTE